MITIQYELTTGMKVSVKEKTFASDAAYDKWLEKMGDRVNVLRYEMA
jgi:hypothetical protein